MTDVVEPAKRSQMMAGIRGSDTKPEILVRRLLHAAGFRYRLHRKDLPGRPDLTLPKYRAAIFVHGCFWHMHEGCRFSTLPSSNVEFWQQKLSGNQARDRRQIESLQSMNWRVLVVWECATRTSELRQCLAQDIIGWLTGDTEFKEIPSVPAAPSQDSAKRSLGKRA